LETTFCGTAQATFHVGSVTDKFTKGECFPAATSQTVNIGTLATLASPSVTKLPPLPYFGLDVGRSAALTTAKAASSDGTYQGGLLTVNYNGADYLVNTLTVTLTHNRTAGSFSGTTGKGQHISGSFSC